MIPGQRYRHYKGGLYEIIELAKLEATGDAMVVYRVVGSQRLPWVRPAREFDEQVGDRPRFTLEEEPWNLAGGAAPATSPLSAENRPPASE